MKQFFKYLKKILNITGKIILVIAVFYFVIILFSIFTSENRYETNTKVIIKDNRDIIYGLINNKVITNEKDGKTMIGFYRFLTCASIGEACSNNPGDGDTNYKYSIFGVLSTAIIYPYINPPASGIYWVGENLQKAGLIPKTFATEGIGFASLKPLTNVWKIFRNISYGLLVIIMISIGFMIMFRVKINPQTMISVENSLPRIVVALILITFSFAISGFLIDLMYLVSGIIISILSNNGIVKLPNDVNHLLFAKEGWSKLFDLVFLNSKIWEIGNGLLAMLPLSVNVILRGAISVGTLLLLKIIPPVGKVLTGEICSAFELGGLGAFICGAAAWTVLTPIIGLFAPLIISLIIFLTTALFVFFRILFLLLAAYLRILFMIIFSPLILLFDAIPGRNNFGKWVKGLVADLILFPLTIGFILLSAIIVNLPSAQGELFQPPLLYSVSPNFFNIILGIGLLFMIPSIGGSIRQLMGIKESPFKLGFSTFFGGTTALASSGYRGAMGFGQLAMYGDRIPGIRTLMRKFTKGEPEPAHTRITSNDT